MHRGGGVAVRKHIVNRLCQAGAAVLISGAGRSLGLHQTPMEDRGCCATDSRATVAPGGATSEKLFCALMPVCSQQRVVSADTPS
jgi:hypothetical protein